MGIAEMQEIITHLEGGSGGPEQEQLSGEHSDTVELVP